MPIEQVKSSAEKLAKNNNIDWKINSLVSQIEWEFKFKWNTLNNLFSFKLTKWKEETLEDSQDFRNALIEEIQKKANLWEISWNDSQDLSEKQYEALANKIIEVKKLTKEIQSGIEELRAEMLNEDFKEIQLTSSHLLTKWLYKPETLKKVDNPENFSDELVWLLVWVVETFTVLWKWWYDISKWIVLWLYHLIEIVRWKSELDTKIKI